MGEIEFSQEAQEFSDSLGKLSHIPLLSFDLQKQSLARRYLFESTTRFPMGKKIISLGAPPTINTQQYIEHLPIPVGIKYPEIYQVLSNALLRFPFKIMINDGVDESYTRSVTGAPSSGTDIIKGLVDNKIMEIDNIHDRIRVYTNKSTRDPEPIRIDLNQGERLLIPMIPVSQLGSSSSNGLLQSLLS